MQPYFSVIIPTYNREHILEKALQSVLAQTYNNYEIIIVNDASLDNTEKIMKNYNSPKIKYFKHEKNLGVSAAKNTGIKMADAPWVIFLGDDDQFKPTLLQRLCETIEERIKLNKPLDMMWTGRTTHLYKNNEILKITNDLWPTPENSFDDESLINFGSGWGFVIKKDLLNKVGLFTETMKMYVDVDILCKALKNGANWCVLPEFLIDIHHYDNCKSITQDTTYARSAENINIILKQHNQFLEKHKKAWKKYNELYLGLSYRALNIKEARTQAKYMFLFNCLNLKLYSLTLKFELLYPIRRLFKKIFNKDKP